MKKQFLQIALLALLSVGSFSSCNQQDERPEGILPSEKIVDMLVDVHIANGIYGQRYSVKLNYKNAANDLYSAVLKKHNIEDSIFTNSMVYYSTQTEEYDEMYQEVVDKLNRMEVEITKQQEEAKKQREDEKQQEIDKMANHPDSIAARKKVKNKKLQSAK